MNKYSSNINDSTTTARVLVINSKPNAIAGYYRTDNVRGAGGDNVTSTVSAINKYSDRTYSTSVNISECNIITGYYRIIENNTSINIGTSNCLTTISDGDNSLIQGCILLPEITGLFISINKE